MVDRHPLVGLSYYRLKQIDFDGSFSYSNIVQIQFEKSSFTAYPNPTNGALALSFSKEINGQVFISNMLGETLLQETVQGKQANMN